MKKFWFPTLILVVLALSTAASIWWMATTRHGDVFGIGLLIFFSGASLITYLIVWPSVYGGGIRILAELRAFSDKTKKSYDTVIKRTEEIEIKSVKELSAQSPQVPIKLGELAYQQLGQTASERLK